MKTQDSHPQRAISLQLLLIVPFVVQIFGAVSLVGYLSFYNGQKAINALASQLMDRTSKAVDQHLDSYLSVPHKLLQMNADAIRLGFLDVRDTKMLERYFWHQMQAYDLSYIGFGLTTGAGGGAGRYDGKTVVIDEWRSSNGLNNALSYGTDQQGNRTQVVSTFTWNNFKETWYTEPVNAKKPVWSRIFTINYPNHPYVVASAGRPLYDANNRLLGVVAIDIHLLKLSDFLRNLQVSRGGQVFILERNGLLIANSGTQKPFVVVKDEIQRLQAIDSPNPVVRGVSQQLQQRFDSFQKIATSQNLQLSLQGELYYVQVTPWRDEYGLDWLVVVSVPKSDFMAQIDANTQSTIWLCFAALGVASVLSVFTSRWITQPILVLNRASKAIASGQLDQTVKESGIQELDGLASSFNYMAGQLQESFTALEESNTELESRVEARTGELKTTLEELRRSQAQVIQSEKMSSLGQLVAGVAHEINNPINFIHGNLTHAQEYTQGLLEFIQLYQQRYPDPGPDIESAAEEIDLEFLQSDLPKMLTSMKLGSDRIRQIVLSLRNFSRMDEAEIKPVSLDEGLDSTLMILQHRLKARPERPEIEVIKDYAQLPLVECYAGQLNQVFMNILVNALDALEEANADRSYAERQAHPSQITIETALMDAKWVQVAISDNGPGIPEQIKQQIFDPFFTTKPVGKGTGMGMSISYQIITEKHQGHLRCFSTPGKGTKFVIQIPIRQKAVS
ncbi:HAMP domain-containing protein [Trichocoleus sp. FACHB-591]|uniref:sensor histidine kinase n=1 Tax=Trichocoleus sp. FACHB-591 TaxID=2692872 RepID=UPI0016890894|nr:ATP-binding protein [Trichocoleus sp. FACHB-591]MBD2094298.1 HAMP domain-containing protein [Trichocoleus sp. FACHB-591]